jgi:hypothetical protein
VTINYSDTASTVAARVSAPTNYLEGLGFRYNNPHYQRRGPSDPANVPFNADTDGLRRLLLAGSGARDSQGRTLFAFKRMAWS